MNSHKAKQTKCVNRSVSLHMQNLDTRRFTIFFYHNIDDNTGQLININVI